MSGGAPTEYEEVVVDSGNSILPDTTLSPGADYLYVLSTSKVNKKLQKLINLVSLKKKKRELFFFVNIIV